LVVQTLTADLHRVGQTGNLLRLVQRHGYLPDWTPARWERAAQELAPAHVLDATPPAGLARPSTAWTGGLDGRDRPATRARLLHSPWGKAPALPP
jgi:hypothetical protein